MQQFKSSRYCPHQPPHPCPYPRPSTFSLSSVPSQNGSLLAQARTMLGTTIEPPSTDFLALLAFHLAPSTRTSYAAALAQFQLWSQTNLPEPTTLDLPSALQRYLLHCVSPPHPGTARCLLAAVTFAASALADSPTLPRSCWVAASALTRLAPTPHRSWFPLSSLFFGTFSLTDHNRGQYGLLLISFLYLLRISETAALLPNDLTPDCLGIHASKRDRTTVWRPTTRFVAHWLIFLQDHLFRSGTPSPAALTRAIGSLSTTTRYTWHALRRGGAATLVHLGTTPDQLTYWER